MKNNLIKICSVLVLFCFQNAAAEQQASITRGAPNVLRQIASAENNHSAKKKKNLADFLRAITVPPAEEHPWLAAITTHYAAKDPFHGFRCSGALIDAHWILTTATCVAGLNPEDIDVYIGSSTLYEPLVDGELRKVRAIHFHENFGLEGAYDYDYGLLELDIPATKQSIPIITPSEFIQLTENYPATSFGRWGYVEPTPFVLKSEKKLILSATSCIEESSRRYYQYAATELTERMICAQEIAPDQDCGGACREIFFEGEPLTAIFAGSAHLIGINSWVNAPINPSDPTPSIDFNAKVPAAYDWIMRRVNGVSLSNYYYFFEVPIGNSKSGRLAITNNSSVPITISPVVTMSGASGSFSVDLKNCAAAIPSGGSCEVAITADGVVFGDNTATATITTSAVEMPSMQLTLRARTLRQLSSEEKRALDLDENIEVFAGGAADWSIDQSDRYIGSNSLLSGLVPFSDSAVVAFYVDGPTRITMAGHVSGDSIFPDVYDNFYPDISGKLSEFTSLNTLPSSSWGSMWGSGYFDVPAGRHLVSLLGWARSTDLKHFGVDNLRIGAPTVELPDYIEVEPSTQISYDPKAEDVDGTIVTYRWEQTGGDSVELVDANEKRLAFLPPGNPGIAISLLSFRLTVTDNSGKSDSDEMTVRVLPNNALPTVSVTAPSKATSGERVYIFLSTSDPDSSMSPSVTIEQIAGPALQLFKNEFSETRHFDVPDMMSSDVAAFKILATDSRGGVAQQIYSIELSPLNKAPVVSAGSDIIVNSGGAFQLSAMASDEDGVIASYQWRQLTGQNTPISTPDGAVSNVIAPITCTSLQLQYQVTVSDEVGASATDDVVVTVNAATGGNCSGSTNPPNSSDDQSGGGGGGSAITLIGLFLICTGLRGKTRYPFRFCR